MSPKGAFFYVFKSLSGGLSARPSPSLARFQLSSVLGWNTSRLYQDKHETAHMAELIYEDILNSIENLHRVINDHSEKHDVKDTLAVGTIVRPVYAISVSITTCTLLKKTK